MISVKMALRYRASRGGVVVVAAAAHSDNRCMFIFPRSLYDIGLSVFVIGGGYLCSQVTVSFTDCLTDCLRRAAQAWYLNFKLARSRHERKASSHITFTPGSQLPHCSHHPSTITCSYFTSPHSSYIPQHTSHPPEHAQYPPRQ